MPGRVEFETEVENDAEDTVKDLEFGLVMEYGGREQPEGEPPAPTIIPPEDGNQPDEHGGGGGISGGGGPSRRKSEGGGPSSKGLPGSGADVVMKDEEEENDPNKDDDGPQHPPPLDTSNSVAFKLALLAMYNERVEKRMETKAVVFDRGLLEFKKVRWMSS